MRLNSWWITIWILVSCTLWCIILYRLWSIIYYMYHKLCYNGQDNSCLVIYKRFWAEIIQLNVLESEATFSLNFKSNGHVTEFWKVWFKCRRCFPWHTMEEMDQQAGKFDCGNKITNEKWKGRRQCYYITWVRKIWYCVKPC